LHHPHLHVDGIITSSSIVLGCRRLHAEIRDASRGRDARWRYSPMASVPVPAPSDVIHSRNDVPIREDSATKDSDEPVCESVPRHRRYNVSMQHVAQKTDLDSDNLFSRITRVSFEPPGSLLRVIILDLD